MVTARGEKQERSRERREALLRAAIELIIEGGIKAVTHRAVSARAGLPAPTAGYYFKTSQDLIEQTLRFHVHERAETLTRLLRTAVSGARSTIEIGERIARALVSGESGVSVAQYEVYLEASRNPLLRDAVAESMQTFQDVAVPVLAALGVRHPEQAAKAFVAVTDGFALHRLTSPLPAEEDNELMLRTIGGLFLAYTLDRAELERRVEDQPFE
ncbi:TetR/AcrR family transcriptional regulator [Amycolatopsis nigrescens]|uniref:TetR/AcrR family transcriptional regulator n=1 Tax=Amycolatopsis nigrescens TaxID=381445 RepID=UPI0003806EB9|nr:TetR family transcriptional regulator [Amycolatopsis nigrescens]